MQSRLLIAFTLIVPLCACGDTAQAPISHDNFTIAVAPLRLDDIIQACYSVKVWAGPGGAGPDDAPNEQVWARQLCSLAYGNGPGGDVSYVGPCDAQAGLHSIELTVDRLDGAPLGSWSNPCPADTPCIIEAPCVENSDVPVTFNLTILRQANQGFVDIAVNIQNIFCSAKFDTCYDGEIDDEGNLGPDRPILLLVAEDGIRRQTGVLAVACTEGYAARGPAHLYFTPIEIDCGDAYSITLDPAAGPGLVYAPPLSHESGEVWQYAVNYGVETQTCADEDGLTQPCPSVYWTIPIGVEGLPPGCSIRATFTPSPEPFPGGHTPVDTAYPVITLDAVITDDSGVICQKNPLNGEGSGVQTEYHPLTEEPIDFIAVLGPKPDSDGVEVIVLDKEPAPVP